MSDVNIIMGDVCNMNCSYCLETKKIAHHKIDFSYIEKLLYLIYRDNVFNEPKNTQHYFDLVGGETFIYIDLLEQTTELCNKLTKQFDWDLKPKFHFFTNGTLLNTPKVKRYLEKYKNQIWLEISIDGIKATHDKTRPFKDGLGSYDLICANLADIPCEFNLRYNLSPENVNGYAEGIQWNIDNGYAYTVQLVQELEWDNAYTLFYNEIKKLFNWYITHDEDWITKHKLGVLWKDRNFKPIFLQDSANLKACAALCGFTLDYKGDLYPCLPISAVVGSSNNYRYGHIDTFTDWLKIKQAIPFKDNNIDRLSDCYRCPIGSRCKPCPFGNEFCAYHGTKKHMCNTYMLWHMEDVLFTNYWTTTVNKHNKVKEHGIDLLIPKTWALEVLTEEEYNYIADLTRNAGGLVNPLSTKFFTLNQVNDITSALKETI